eukprot:m.82803 g.82803  ORF g.82803 m.82803 type:complete len:358 (+) comp12701_c0_seq1:92-1165(+)
MGRTPAHLLAVLVCLLVSQARADTLASLGLHEDLVRSARSGGSNGFVMARLHTAPINGNGLNNGSEGVEEGVGEGTSEVTPERIFGTYAAGCQEETWFDRTADKYYNISSMKTLRYKDDNTFEADYTEYLYVTQEHKCHPSETDVFAKYKMQGTISYHGISAIDKTAMLAAWQVSQSQWLFPQKGSTTTRAILSILNSQCACGGEWVAGTWRTIVPSTQCTAEEINKPNKFYLCDLIVGTESYGVYTWADAHTYISSYMLFDKTTAWSQKPTSTPRHELIETGNQDPTDCDYVRWSMCGASVRTGADACDTCDGLECSGCLYEVLPEVKDPSAYGDCCPCIWFYAEQYNEPWMKINC